jgi:hypothetical protein
LHLHARRQPIRDDPVSELAGLKSAMTRRKQYIGDSVEQLVLIAFNARPIVIATTTKDEFDLVVGL